MVIVNIRTGESLGCIRLEDGELSFFIGSCHWRRGYASMALRMLSTELDGGHRQLIFALTDRNNIGACRVLEATGFRFRKTSLFGDLHFPMLRYERWVGGFD